MVDVSVCRRNNGENGYVPANYVKEIEPKIVSVEVKKPVVVKDVRKVKKTQYIKQRTPVNNQKSGKPKEPYTLPKKVIKTCPDWLITWIKLCMSKRNRLHIHVVNS